MYEKGEIFMNLSNRSIRAIANIKTLFDLMEKEFNLLNNEEHLLNNEEQEKVFEFHNCLRWGQQVAEEIFSECKQTGKKESRSYYIPFTLNGGLTIPADSLKEAVEYVRDEASIEELITGIMDANGRIDISDLVIRIEAEPEVGEDLTEYLDNNLEDMVEGHLEAWEERYHRKKMEDVVFDLRVNYDWSGEHESLEEHIGRELTDDEKTYFKEAFIEEVEKSFYL